MSSCTIFSNAEVQSWGQTDNQRWLITYEIANGNAFSAWLDITALRPAEDHAHVITERNRLVCAERQKAELRQTWVGPSGGLQAAIDDTQTQRPALAHMISFLSLSLSLPSLCEMTLAMSEKEPSQKTDSKAQTSGAGATWWPKKHAEFEASMQISGAKSWCGTQESAGTDPLRERVTSLPLLVQEGAASLA